MRHRGQENQVIKVSWPVWKARLVGQNLKGGWILLCGEQ